jgi:DNA-binding Lrp family transcriptional regulator
LTEDPTRSVRDIAKDMGSYRQKVWRKKKKLEDDHVIWGYTAVVDESVMNQVMYILLMKLKPMSTDLAELMKNRILQREPEKQNVRLLNVLYVNGEYDLVVMFTGPDHSTARRYFDSLRMAYDEHLIEKPVIIDVNLSLMREGKINPNISKIFEYVPI